MPHASDSGAQRAAEPLIVDAVAAFVGVELAAETIDLGDGVKVQIDGASVDRSLLVEAFAHVGPLLSGQTTARYSSRPSPMWAHCSVGRAESSPPTRSSLSGPAVVLVRNVW